MSTFSLIGNDDLAAYLRALRAQLGDQAPEFWSEFETIVYDTVRDFERLPELNFPMDFPGIERLTDDEKRGMTKIVTQYLTDFGTACRRDMFLELLRARVEARLAKK